jgi:hypothetical protein
VAIGSMSSYYFIIFDLPPASFLRAISIPTRPSLNGKRFSESLVVLKPWRCHIQGLFLSQLNTFCFAIYLISEVQFKTLKCRPKFPDISEPVQIEVQQNQ